MAEIELKPCPFCGNTDIRSDFMTLENGVAVGIVYCNKCCGQVRSRAGEKTAINLWNMRADKDFAKDVITALKNEIDNDTDDFGVGYACGLDRAILIIKRLIDAWNGRKHNGMD